MQGQEEGAQRQTSAQLLKKKLNQRVNNMLEQEKAAKVSPPAQPPVPQ